MATTYKTPGAYVEEIPKLPPSIAEVETAIPAFIGYTEKAIDKIDDDLLLKPTRIASLLEFQQHFGGPQPEEKLTVSIEETTTATPGKPVGFTSHASLDTDDRSKHVLYYAMQHFYENGGGPAYVVSAGPFGTLGADLKVKGLTDALDPLRKADEPTLIVVPEAAGLPIDDFKDLVTDLLDHCGKLGDRFAILDVHGDDEPLSEPGSNLVTGINNFRDKVDDNVNLKYGAAYAPFLETTLDYSVDESTVDVSHSLDGAAATTAKLDKVESGLAERARAAIRAKPLVLPPSAAMAGIYARVDEDRGVWKAPANVSVNAVVKPTIEFSNDEQDQMNIDPTTGKSVNAIRPFVGKGTKVWGARTLAGNDNEWRYINVRRFFNFAEESIKKAVDAFTFEPNDANTWVKVQGMIENFLTTQWRNGALQGIKPEHAFYVSVGLGKTMTPLDILEGRMIIEIGLAVVRPAEFIVLRFSHKLAES